MNNRVVVLYAPDVERIKIYADEIKNCFIARNFNVIVKSAKKSSMTDIIAANIVIIGTLPEDKKPIHSDFKEIVRSLQGINLASRITGFFTPDSDKTINSLHKAVNDSDIKIYNQALYIDSEKVNSENVKGWVNKIIELYRKDNNDRLL